MVDHFLADACDVFARGEEILGRQRRPEGDPYRHRLVAGDEGLQQAGQPLPVRLPAAQPGERVALGRGREDTADDCRDNPGPADRCGRDVYNNSSLL